MNCIKLHKITKILFNIKSKHCYVCISKSFLTFASYAGLSSKKHSCPHSKPPTRQCEFHFSKWDYVFPVILLVTISSAIVKSFADMITETKADIDVMTIVNYIAENVLVLSNVGLAAFGILKMSAKIKEEKGFSSVLENAHLYGLAAVIEEGAIVKLQKLAIIIICTVFLALAFSSARLFTFSYEDFTNTWTMTRFVVKDLMSIYTTGALTGLVIFNTNISSAVLTHCYRMIEINLTNSLGSSNDAKRLMQLDAVNKSSRHIGEDFQGHCSQLLLSLRKLQKLHMTVIANLNLTMDYLNPVPIVWMACTFTFSVLNIFVLVVKIVRGITLYDLLITIVKLVTLSVPMGTAAIYMEALQHVSDDIISFLFRYPISKLNPAEAAQVEMMIATFTTQKPILKASDIFTIGTRLLAAISGTVVTYVLVALQFHASWSKRA